MKSFFLALAICAISHSSSTAEHANVESATSVSTLHVEKMYVENENNHLYDSSLEAAAAVADARGSAVAMSWDKISRDAYVHFSLDLMGKKFHLIDSRDEIFLSKSIVAVSMGIDMDALEAGQYFVVTKGSTGVISQSFVVPES